MLTAPATPATVNAPTSRFDATLVLCFAAALLSFALPMPRAGSIAGMPSPCFFYSALRLPCPGCGLTRSFVCAAHGHFADAFAFHPLGPPMLGALLLYLLWRGARSLKWLAFEPSRAARQRLLRVGIALLIGVWAFRLAGFWPLPA